MLQAIEIEAQPEQPGLALLQGHQAAGSANQAFALHRREDTFGPRRVLLESAPKRSPHLRTHPAYAPGFLPVLRWDHAPCPELLPGVGGVPLAVELGVGQHQSDASLLEGGLHENRQVRTVVPLAMPRHLCQQVLPVQVNHHDPLQPISPLLFAEMSSIGWEHCPAHILSGACNAKSPTSAIALTASVQTDTCKGLIPLKFPRVRTRMPTEPKEVYVFSIAGK